eukprot:2191262-Rhodomonas_salina.3
MYGSVSFMPHPSSTAVPVPYRTEDGGPFPVPFPEYVNRRYSTGPNVVNLSSPRPVIYTSPHGSPHGSPHNSVTMIIAPVTMR